jgi:hypothetical protein
MNAQIQPPPVPSYHPADFFDPATFVQARLQAWQAVSGDINPGNEILPVLESAWITEWMRCHADRIGLAIRATVGIPSEELARYTDMGGMKKLVADFRSVRGTADAQREHIEALQAALRSIAEHRHVHAGTQTAEQMLEGIALKAFEAMAYGRLPEPVRGTASSGDAQDAQADAVASEADALAAAAQLIEQAQADAIEGDPAPALHEPPPANDEDGAKRRFHAKVEGGMAVMTAQRFVAMAGIRKLSDRDGAAHPSDGTYYDPLTTISPERPVPHGITHIVWKEFAAQPVNA